MPSSADDLPDDLPTTLQWSLYAQLREAVLQSRAQRKGRSMSGAVNKSYLRGLAFSIQPREGPVSGHHVQTTAQTHRPRVNGHRLHMRSAVKHAMVGHALQLEGQLQLRSLHYSWAVPQLKNVLGDAGCACHDYSRCRLDQSQ